MHIAPSINIFVYTKYSETNLGTPKLAITEIQLRNNASISRDNRMILLPDGAFQTLCIILYIYLLTFGHYLSYTIRFM